MRPRAGTERPHGETARGQPRGRGSVRAAGHQAQPPNDPGARGRGEKRPAASPAVLLPRHPPAALPTRGLRAQERCERQREEKKCQSPD